MNFRTFLERYEVDPDQRRLFRNPATDHGGGFGDVHDAAVQEFGGGPHWWLRWSSEARRWIVFHRIENPSQPGGSEVKHEWAYSDPSGNIRFTKFALRAEQLDSIKNESRYEKDPGQFSVPWPGLGMDARSPQGDAEAMCQDFEAAIPTWNGWGNVLDNYAVKGARWIPAKRRWSITLKPKPRAFGERGEATYWVFNGNEPVSTPPLKGELYNYDTYSPFRESILERYREENPLPLFRNPATDWRATREIEAAGKRAWGENYYGVVWNTRVKRWSVEGWVQNPRLPSGRELWTQWAYASPTGGVSFTTYLERAEEFDRDYQVREARYEVDPGQIPLYHNYATDKQAGAMVRMEAEKGDWDLQRVDWSYWHCRWRIMVSGNDRWLWAYGTPGGIRFTPFVEKAEKLDAMKESVLERRYETDPHQRIFNWDPRSARDPAADPKVFEVDFLGAAKKIWQSDTWDRWGNVHAHFRLDMKRWVVDLYPLQGEDRHDPVNYWVHDKAEDRDDTLVGELFTYG